MYEKFVALLNAYSFDFDEPDFFVDVVKNAKPIDSQLPFSRFVRTQLLAIASFLSRLMFKLFFDSFDHPFSVDLPQQTNIFNRFRDEFDLKHHLPLYSVSRSSLTPAIDHHRFLF